MKLRDIWQPGKRLHLSLLIIIIIIGGGLRFYHLGYGLPRMYLTDEEFFTGPALKIASGSLNPGWFGAPSSPQIYATGWTWRIVNAVHNVTTGEHQAVRTWYAADPTVLQTVGRAIPALIGTLTILLAYLIGRRVNRRTSLIAAALVSLNFFLIDQSHVIRPDIIQTFFLLGVLYLVLRIIERPDERKNYLWAGISFGLAITSKYPSLFFLPAAVPLLTYLWLQGKLRWKMWWMFAAVTLVTIVISAPYLFITPLVAIKDLAKENGVSHGVHGNFTWRDNLPWYLGSTVNWELGTAVYGVVIIFLGWLVSLPIRRRRFESDHVAVMVITIPAIVYLFATSLLHLHWARWAIPVTTILLIVAAAGIDRLWTLVRWRWVMVLITIIIALGPLWRLGRWVYGYARPYTVEQARSWILQNLPSGTALVIEPYDPVLPKNYPTIPVPNLSWRSAAAYKREGATYVVANSAVDGDIVIGATRPELGRGFRAALKGYVQLFAATDLTAEFLPHPSWTTNELLYTNDFRVLRTFDLRLQKGPAVHILRLQ